MVTRSKFYYPIVLHRNNASNYNMAAPSISQLPAPQTVDEFVVILNASNQGQDQGLYAFDEQIWRYALSVQDISASIVRGDNIDVYVNPTTDIVVTMGLEVYRNGYRIVGNVVSAGRSVYVVRTPPQVSTGAVSSVNGKVGIISITGANGINVDSSGAAIVIQPDSLNEGTF